MSYKLESFEFLNFELQEFDLWRFYLWSFELWNLGLWSFNLPVKKMTGNFTGYVANMLRKNSDNCEFDWSTFDDSLTVISGVILVIVVMATSIPS